MTASMAFLVAAGIMLFTAATAHLLSKAEPRGFALGYYKGTALGALIGVAVLLLMSVVTRAN
jgi:hypothetical protein